MDILNKAQKLLAANGNSKRLDMEVEESSSNVELSHSSNSSDSELQAYLASLDKSKEKNIINDLGKSPEINLYIKDTPRSEMKTPDNLGTQKKDICVERESVEDKSTIESANQRNETKEGNSSSNFSLTVLSKEAFSNQSYNERVESYVEMNREIPSFGHLRNLKDLEITSDEHLSSKTTDENSYTSEIFEEYEDISGSNSELNTGKHKGLATKSIKLPINDSNVTDKNDVAIKNITSSKLKNAYTETEPFPEQPNKVHNDFAQQLPYAFYVPYLKPPTEKKLKSKFSQTETDNVYQSHVDEEDDSTESSAPENFKSINRCIIDQFVSEHIRLLNHFVDMNREMMDTYKPQRKKYTTLEETKDFIKRKKSSIITLEEALREVEYDS